jgi:hypothetical protein
MNALAPPKRSAPGREIAGAAKLRLRTTYRVAALLATTFGWPFWFAGQWCGRLQDRIENGRNNR